jgi:cell division protein FtsW
MSHAATLGYARVATRSRRLELDPILMLTTGALLAIGLVMVTSASITVADRSLGNPFYFLERQLLYTGFGIAAATIAINIPAAIWERLAFVLLIAAFAALILVLVPGIGAEVNGSRRWVRLGLMNFQVSELARVLLLMYLASYIVRRQAELRESLNGFLKPLGLLLGAAALLLAEPDFGAATVLVATGLGMLFLAGVKLRHFFALVTLAGSGLALLAITSAYRMKRLVAFLDPWADPFNSGFQLTQSLIAIGRGELFGVGLGASVQKLFYLPEAHTDFVFAVLAEELGLVGVVATLALFVVLAGRALFVARRAAAAGLPFQAFVAASFGIWLGLQASINIGVNMGILPTKGLTLPLLSYGGSSLLVTLGWLGVVMRIHHESCTSGRSAVPRRERRR